MGVMKFKTAKFLEHLVVIIIDCGDKLFFISYKKCTVWWASDQSANANPCGRGASATLLFLGLHAFANSELPKESRPASEYVALVFL